MKNKNIITGLAAASLVLSTPFLATSCNKKEQQEPVEVYATPVTYNKKGEFLTTISNIDDKNITKEDIKITYYALDYKDVKEDEEPKLVEKTVPIKNVAKNNDGTISVQFNDTKLETSLYTVHIEKLNKVALVNVDQVNELIETDTKCVLASQNNFVITLGLNATNFEPSITKEDITLGGSFKDLNISHIYQNEKNLTLDLDGELYRRIEKNKKGEIVTDEPYYDGEIVLSSKIFSDSSEDQTVFIPVIEKI